MRRSLLAMVFGTLAVGGMTLAHHDEHGEGGVKTLSRKDISEEIDGKNATTVEVTLGPGESDAPHRHPGPAFGYVLEGEYEWAIDDNPTRTLKAGDTFYEPTDCLHHVSRNPGRKGTTRVLAVVPHPRECHPLGVPGGEEVTPAAGTGESP